MTKELTDKVKDEIVLRQINFLKLHHPNESMNYDKLSKYLRESLEEDSSKNGKENERVDLKLLKNLEEGNSKLITRMFNAAMHVNNSLYNKGEVSERIIYREDVKDMHLLKLYKYHKEDGREIRDYGKRTAKLLEEYLTRKGLIEEVKE